MTDPIAKAPTSDDVAWADPKPDDDITGILGFDFGSAGAVDRSGLRALVNSSIVSQRRLPMLEVVLDRTARLMTTSLRQLTDDNVEVALDNISSTRFGEYMQSATQSAVIGVVRAAPLNNYCLIAADAALVYSIVDLLLGGRRGPSAFALDDRGFTAIELGLAQRILTLLVEDLGEAFRPVADGPFSLERLETTPRFAAIAQDASVCVQAKYRVRIEDRGGRITVLFPYASLEPVRRTLRQEFLGEAMGAEEDWRARLSSELAGATIDVAAVLAEKMMTLGALQELRVGEIVVFPRAAGDAIELRSGASLLGRGRVGRSGEAVAVKLETSIARLHAAGRAGI